MAAAFLRHHGGDSVRVSSAGSAPADAVNPVVVEAMHEVGLDMTSAVPVKLADAAVEAADVVVTMGCGDACPVYPGKRYLDWKLDDPAGADLPAVRRIRDDIEQRVLGLLADVTAAP